MTQPKLLPYTNRVVIKRWLLAAGFIFLSTTLLPAQTGAKKVVVKDPQDTFPVPPASTSQLFYLQRTANTNTVVYECNYNSQGILDERNPILVYWIRYTEGGVKKELSYIQRTFAYGVKTQLLADGNHSFHVVSYKKQQMTVKRSTKDYRFHVYATINHKEVLLTRIFIKVDGGAFWSPNVIYIEMKGKDETTGEEVMERFNPKL